MQKYTLSELQHLTQPLIDVWYYNNNANHGCPAHAEKIISMDGEAIVFKDCTIDAYGKVTNSKSVGNFTSPLIYVSSDKSEIIEKYKEAKDLRKKDISEAAKIIAKYCEYYKAYSTNGIEDSQARESLSESEKSNITDVCQWLAPELKDDIEVSASEIYSAMKMGHVHFEDKDDHNIDKYIYLSQIASMAILSRGGRSYVDVNMSNGTKYCVCENTNNRAYRILYFLATAEE